MCGFNDIYKKRFKRPLRHLVRVMRRHDLTKKSVSLFFRSVFSESVSTKKYISPVNFMFNVHMWNIFGFTWVTCSLFNFHMLVHKSTFICLSSQVKIDILVNKSQVNPDIWVHLSPIELVYGLTNDQWPITSHSSHQRSFDCRRASKTCKTQ